MHPDDRELFIAVRNEAAKGTPILDSKMKPEPRVLSDLAKKAMESQQKWLAQVRRNARKTKAE